VSVSTASEADEGTSGTFVPEDQPVNEIGGDAEERGKGEGDADVVESHHVLSLLIESFRRDQR
jgi:hypothetical protein